MGTPVRVLFLMSDTGGGHRAAAEAIQTAMESLYPDHYTFDIVDVFRDYTPFPFRHMPQFYPRWVNFAGITWKIGYLLINLPLLSTLILDIFYLFWRQGLIRLFREHPADVVICVHSLFNRAALRSLRHHTPDPPPFITVVTDLVSTPVFWYQPSVDLCFVPTRKAYQRGLRQGVQADKLKLLGLPVHPEFVNSLQDKSEARLELNWDQDALTVLLVGGGEGMGPVYKIARAIDKQKLDIHLVIIAGHNEKLRTELENCEWNQPTDVYPFISMPQFMSASDILITKAGPATVSEACVAGLPIIISGFVPGQESGNVEYIVENNAGVYAPGPERVATVLAKWVHESDEQRENYARAASALGRPRAAWDIATEIHCLLE